MLNMYYAVWLLYDVQYDLWLHDIFNFQGQVA